MRMLLQVNLPHKPFNAAVKDGTVGSKINSILQDTKPEAVYFTEIDGQRCAMMVVNVEHPSKIPFRRAVVPNIRSRREVPARHDSRRLEAIGTRGTGQEVGIRELF